MRRYGWVLTVLIIVAFFVIRHRSVPYAPAPANAVTISQGIRVPVATKLPQGTGEVWVLAKMNNKEYVVNVYNKQSLLHVFKAGSEVSQDSSGTTYQAEDDIRLGYTEYQATAIHVNPDGRSGYIELKEVSNPNSTGNQTGNQ